MAYSRYMDSSGIRVLMIGKLGFRELGRGGIGDDNCRKSQACDSTNLEPGRNETLKPQTAGNIRSTSHVTKGPT